MPAYYKGMPDTVIGPDDVIPWPAWTDHLDHELELAAVIGREACDVPADEAERCIFGYTIWNDVSARDVQARELPVGMGPAGEGLGWLNVLGPCLVTADQLDAAALTMRVRVNGGAVGRGHLRKHAPHVRGHDLLRVPPQTLHPGEVLGSGTAAGGSGLGLDRRLAPGDVVELEVEGIGVLRNPIGEKGAG